MTRPSRGPSNQEIPRRETWNPPASATGRKSREHIASTGQIPHYDTTTEDPAKKRRKDAFDQMQRIIDAMPTGTPLATMTDDDIRRELENRDA